MKQLNNGTTIKQLKICQKIELRVTNNNNNNEKKKTELA